MPTVNINDLLRDVLPDKGALTHDGDGLVQGGRQRFELPQDLLWRAVEIDVCHSGRQQALRNGIKSRVDQQSKGQIGIGGGVR